MAKKIEIPARCTDPRRFEAMVRRMLAIPFTASDQQFRRALEAISAETLLWYDHRIGAIKDAALNEVPPGRQTH